MVLVPISSISTAAAAATTAAIAAASTSLAAVILAKESVDFLCLERRRKLPQILDADFVLQSFEQKRKHEAEEQLRRNSGSFRRGIGRWRERRGRGRGRMRCRGVDDVKDGVCFTIRKPKYDKKYEREDKTQVMEHLFDVG